MSAKFEYQMHINYVSGSTVSNGTFNDLNYAKETADKLAKNSNLVHAVVVMDDSTGEVLYKAEGKK